ncbi:family 16 glycoside hydrolase [Neorhodopirellula pilleata]|uniref:thioredoxin-dependent peroxiredoxin n=1 Tax=Neorhodopirellula pilleata TaxID=2714738 RepID=A0A5C5ZQN0_9BACT|nr:family 16 glycoside hydrolase [Neorhodopirellula pilleata]TWT89217.1 putative peroxiredoxin bcp [Neorhodopirellula pilleata]
MICKHMFTGAALCLMLLACTSAKGEVEVGDPLPEFVLQGSDGKTYSSTDLIGEQAIVIAWFPKAFTGGCTKECKSLRENSDQLKAFDVAYFAASCDTPELNADFAKSLDLDYPILSDPSKRFAKALGCLNERGVSNRWTYYVGVDGKVLHIDKAVQTASHGESVAAKLAELGVAKRTANTDESAHSTEFESLFNGVDLEGWKHSGNWSVVNGEITREGKGGSLTYAKSKVPDDFELRFEWKVGEGSNSGVYYRPGQYEYQILDNSKHRDGENPRTSAASLYFCMQPSEDATRPVGQWNQARIVGKGTVVQHWLNGKKVIDFDYTDPKWAFNVDMLEKRGGKLDAREGSLSLQDHGDPVWYRNIQMRTIPADEPLNHDPIQPAEISEEVLKKEKEKLDAIVNRRKKA